MTKPHSTVREGTFAGGLGATVVAIWFLIVDVIAAHPLHTPLELGAALFSILGPLGMEPPLLYVVAYTIVHYALFILAGVVATALIHASQREPSVLAGAFVLFIVLELAFHGFVSLLANTVLRELAWYNVAIGNLLAAIVMGTYLWRRHPMLGKNLSYSLSGKERRDTLDEGTNANEPVAHSESSRSGRV